MVRWIALTLAFLLAGAVEARAAPDWRRAGGDLFVGDGPAAAQAHEGTPLAPGWPARLPPLAQPFEADIAEAAARHGLDPKLLHALVVVESAYRPRAVSPAGAAGLTQLTPATAADLGVRDRFDPEANLRGGADYLARLLSRFGDLRLALAAYNAGPAVVARAGRIPDTAETRAYVAAVIDCYLALTAGRSVSSAAACRLSRPSP